MGKLEINRLVESQFVVCCAKVSSRQFLRIWEFYTFKGVEVEWYYPSHPRGPVDELQLIEPHRVGKVA
jgi:hypothetical protein